MINISITVDYEAVGNLLSLLSGGAPVTPAQAEVEAVKRTRTRKPKETPVNETLPPVEATPPAPAAPEPPKIPTDKEVQEALVAVNDKHGIDKAIECLNKFNVKRGRELRDDQKIAFVELCKTVLG